MNITYLNNLVGNHRFEVNGTVLIIWISFGRTIISLDSFDRSFTIENTFFNEGDVNGMTGTRVTQMMDRSLTPNEEMGIYQTEQESKKAGKPLQIRTVNIPALMDLDLYFYATVSAKERESTELDKAMVTDMINQGMAISQVTGRPLNPEKLVQKFERVWHERDLFQKAAPQPMMPQEAVQESQSAGAMKPRGMSPTGELTKAANIV